MCDMTHSIVWNDLFIYVTWLIHTCDITQDVGMIESVHEHLHMCSYNWVMAQIWMSLVTHLNESCHTCEWVVPHIWMSHVIGSCHTYEWVMSHIWRRHVTHMKVSRHAYEWVMSHIWMSHVIRMNESCHTYEWVMSRQQMERDWECPWAPTHYESFHIYEWVMSHVWMSHVTTQHLLCGHDSFFHVSRDSFIHATWLIHICEMTHNLEKIESIHTHLYLHLLCGHDSFISVT